MRLRGESLCRDYAQRCEAHMRKFGGQDGKWLMTARAKGTVRDKIAAASLLVERNAVGHLTSLEMLVQVRLLLESTLLAHLSPPCSL